MRENTVSLCMIVKDEEVYLKRCLDSVSNQVDEIIIVDTGSTDSTVSIAKEYEAKIFTYEWDKDFAAARNFSLEKAQSDYVLVLDADEYLDENTDIQNAIKEQKDIYIINFKNYSDGGYVTKHQAIRLFKNSIGLKYSGKIHEHLNIADFDNLTNDISEFNIHHDGYKNETYHKKNKYNRNLEILEKEVKDNPTGYNLFNLGTQYKAGNNYEKALETFRKSYPYSKNQLYLPYLLYSMGDCLYQLGRNKDGINLIKDSSELFPKYTGFYYLMGLYYEKLNYLKASEESFEKCLELGEVENLHSLDGVGSYLAYIKLAEIQHKQGNLLKALDSSFAALEINKKFPPALSQYITVLKSAGINENDLNENLKKSYPIKDVKDLEVLFSVLIAHRSKLLQKYIEEYKIEVNNSVFAIVAIYNKQYDDACAYWNKEEIFDTTIFSDILALLIVQENEELLLKLLKNMNLNKNEKKAVQSLVINNDGIMISLPDSLFEIIKNVLINLLRIEEETVFLDVYRRLTLNELEKEQLISLIIHNGYLSIAVDLLTEELKSNSSNDELMGLLADVYTRQNRYNDALELYMQLIEKIGDYSSYNRLHCLYEKIQYNEGLHLLKKQMETIIRTDFGISATR